MEIRRSKPGERTSWKKLFVFLGLPAVAGLGGALSMVQFVKRIAPHLTEDEGIFAVIYGLVAIICFSTLGAQIVYLWWKVLTRMEPVAVPEDPTKSCRK
jgi:hypothetical protein